MDRGYFNRGPHPFICERIVQVVVQLAIYIALFLEKLKQIEMIRAVKWGVRNIVLVF